VRTLGILYSNFSALGNLEWLVQPYLYSAQMEDAGYTNDFKQTIIHTLIFKWCAFWIPKVSNSSTPGIDV